MGGNGDGKGGSHPTWVRGLKFKYLLRYGLGLFVAPYMGAWIEMLTFQLLLFVNIRRTLHGCVD